jgi:hypothetical protein
MVEVAEAADKGLIEKLFERERWAALANILVVAVVVSLPWSTSITGILILLWLIALIPTLDAASLRQALMTPAGGIPTALWVLTLFGMLWSIGSLAERLDAFQAFVRLLAIPLLLVQFRRSGDSRPVLGGVLISCTVLLLLSFVTKAWPWMWRPVVTPGVPVKEYITQSGEFLLCAFGLTHWAIGAWQQNRRSQALACIVLALLFLANIVFVATGRTSLVMFAVLIVGLGFQRFGWKGALGLAVAGVILASAAWTSSVYLRERIMAVSQEVNRYETNGTLSSSGYRLAWWRKSLDFVAAAPVLGHGTGSTPAVFRRAAAGDPSLEAEITNNPHNQTLSIAIQLGLVGAGLLWAMWIAHLLLFRGGGIEAWIGAGVVVQNVVGSLFNSQLIYFTPGWTYVFGVGVLGGIVLRGGAGWRQRPNAAKEMTANPPG